MRRYATSMLAGFLGLSSIGAGLVTSGCAHSASGDRAAVAKKASAPSVHIDPSIKFVKATSTGFTLTERFEFVDNKDSLRPSAEALLSEVATVLKGNPDLLVVYIAGFSSSEGGADRNQTLSANRAATVKSWLVAHGIDGERLRTGGFGSTHPAGDNESKEGREMNRRVEFVALKYRVDNEIVEGTAPAILETPDVK